MFATDRRSVSIMGVLLAAAAGACGDVAAPPPESTASLARLVVTSGDAQHAPEGHPLPLPLQVRVTDASGNLAAGVAVRFSVTSGGGTIADAITRTDAAGIAESGAWTLGAAAEPQRVLAQSEGLQASFTATAEKLPAARGVFDLTATIRSYDAAWGIDLDGAYYAAVVLLHEVGYDAGYLATRFDAWRVVSPDGIQHIGSAVGGAHFTTPAQLHMDVDRLGWSMRGTLLASGDIEGTWGCCGHIAGTFTMRRQPDT
jgi:hypothetical protein